MCWLIGPGSAAAARSALSGRPDGDVADFDVIGLLDGERDGARHGVGADAECRHGLLGLLSLPDALLNTPVAELDADAQQRLKNHADITEEILMPLPFFMRATPLISEMDERFDGSGPRGQQGTGISTLARVLQVAVAFDQAVQGGPGRAPMAGDAALKHLESLKGTQLDPELVDRFVRIVAANPELAACPS